MSGNRWSAEYTSEELDALERSTVYGERKIRDIEAEIATLERELERQNESLAANDARARYLVAEIEADERGVPIATVLARHAQEGR